jgi:predicted acetyltransferase
MPCHKIYNPLLIILFCSTWAGIRFLAGTMNIQLIEASIEHRHVLERLMQLYLYDFSEFEGFDIGPDGLYENEHINLYWTDSDRHAFLISAADRFAGFILVNSFVCLEENSGARSIAEFFVMRKYRRQGVGRVAARKIFDLMPGRWEVRQIHSNTVGQHFWRNVIGEYTAGKFTETVLNNEKWNGPVQSFDCSDIDRS